MARHAFTLLELVFVIVVAGILAAVVIPRYERDSLYEMAEQVLSHIQYTQHLAMTQDIYRDDRDDWYEARWQLNFIDTSECGVFYRIGSNADLSDASGDYGIEEAARDTLTREAIYNSALVCEYHEGWYNGVLLGLKYGVVDMTTSANCSKTIAFDNIGRPYTGVAGDGPTDKLILNDCEYTFTHSNGSQVKITVTAETGYAFITYI